MSHGCLRLRGSNQQSQGQSRALGRGDESSEATDTCRIGFQGRAQRLRGPCASLRAAQRRVFEQIFDVIRVDQGSSVDRGRPSSSVSCSVAPVVRHGCHDDHLCARPRQGPPTRADRLDTTEHDPSVVDGGVTGPGHDATHCFETFLDSRDAFAPCYAPAWPSISMDHRVDLSARCTGFHPTTSCWQWNVAQPVSQVFVPVEASLFLVSSPESSATTFSISRMRSRGPTRPVPRRSLPTLQHCLATTARPGSKMFSGLTWPRAPWHSVEVVQNHVQRDD